jgi:hypothetical protein
MNASNSLPVAYSLEPIRARDLAMQPELLTRDMRWAYADPGDLRHQMRRAFGERPSLQRLTEQARHDLGNLCASRSNAVENAT